jgi:two-component system CheB/CheR fusion protein
MDSGEDKVGEPFPIIGVGASAGGLNAFQCFIGALPKEFGFAVVFMQHLSAKHRSLLPELLHNRRPDISIHEISGTARILSGKIYLCPPAAEVRLQEGTFHVIPAPEEHVHLPIDEFLTSLAEDAGERAIAVILSGAGTDGARGIQAIRKAGGSVFVQEPDTAEFPAMPLAAISTGSADRVLPPEDIAREIVKLHGFFPAGADTDIAPEEFDALARLIYEKTGHSFTHYKKNMISRRIKRRMSLRGVWSVRDYTRLIAEKDFEAANVAADLMIGVTSFFRDPLAWKALKTGVIRKLAAQEEDQPVRVWTPACATGEEAYSIAMMLRQEFELSGGKREVQVFATDVNDAALEKAREGRYPGSIVADVPPDYMKKFFTCSEDGLSVIIGKEIRDSVVFARQDLLSDPPFSRLDLIICRNLLIYLEPDAQERCILLFHYGLKDGGYLFLGNAESPGRKSPLFKSLAHRKCRIYQKIETNHPVRLPFAVPFAPESAAAMPSRVSAEYELSVIEVVQQALLEESGPAAVAINQHYDIVYNNGPTNRYLRQPRGAPTQSLLELLPEDLRNRIRGALFRASQEARPVTVRATIPGDDGQRKEQVTLHISKLRDNLFLVIFRQRNYKKGAPHETTDTVAPDVVHEDAVRQLENELSSTRQELHSNIEQLRSLNEELQSSNEELQAANEELETSREELQSLNEELNTVNAQLQSRIEEQEETNNDLNNFVSSTNIPTVFLDHQFRVKRFTPSMSTLLKLIPSDVGRPIIDMSQENLGPDLIADAKEVLRHLAPMKREIAINGSWYVRTTLPYRTAADRVEGVVITYNDVSDLKRAESVMRSRLRLLTTAYTGAVSVDGVLRMALDEIEMQTGSVIGFYHFLEADEETLTLQSWSSNTVKNMCTAEGKGRHYNISQAGVWVDCVRERRPVIHNDYASLPHRKGMPAGHAPVVREMIIPVFRGDRIAAIIGVGNKPADYNAADVEIASHLGDFSWEIVEHKRAEEKLLESEERLKRAQEIAHLGSWELDLITDNLSWSDEVYRIFGQKPQEFAATYEAFLDAVHPDDRGAVEAAYSGSIREGRDSYEIEHRVVRKSTGEIRHVHEKCEHMRDESGRIIRSVGMVHDITERKHAEEKLRASWERSRSYIEVTGQLGWTTNADGEVIEDLPSWRAYTGQTYDEVKGWGWAEALHPDDVEYAAQVWRKAVEEKRMYEVEYRIRRHDGIYRLFMARGIPVFKEDGSVREWVGTCIDITERKQAEADVLKLSEDMAARNVELERANREMEAFTYSISHDLRAPLRSMAGFAGILMQDYAKGLDKQVKDYLERILRGSEKMTRLIDDLLRLSGISRQQMEKTQVDLSAIASSVVSDMHEADPERRVSVRIEEGLSAFADRPLIEIVLSNLLGNAWKFTSRTENARIEFGSIQQEGRNIFYVRDNGAGFDSQYMKKMFLPFQRLHSDQEFEGTGIGLTIIERIIHRHGGRIWAEGEKGKGATIYFTLGQDHDLLSPSSREGEKSFSDPGCGKET